MKKNKKWIMLGEPLAGSNLIPHVKYLIEDEDTHFYYTAKEKFLKSKDGNLFTTGSIFSGSGYEKGV